MSEVKIALGRIDGYMQNLSVAYFIPRPRFLLKPKERDLYKGEMDKYETLEKRIFVNPFPDVSYKIGFGFLHESGIKRLNHNPFRLTTEG